MFKKILRIASWTLVAISIILLIFGFGEDGLKILHIIRFWIIVDSLWILAALLLLMEKRIKK